MRYMNAQGYDTLQVIDLTSAKSQSLIVTLAGQQVGLRLLQRTTGMYMDITLNNDPILQGIPCLYGVKMVRSQCLGFKGDLVFLDRLGNNDPSWSGLGSRYVLYYIPDRLLGS